MKKLLPILLALLGTAAGVTAGMVLKPEVVAEQGGKSDGQDTGCGPRDGIAGGAALPEDPEASGVTEFVKMNNQFVVPVVTEDRVASLVVLSLSVEVPAGQSESVFAREPKLRDLFLQELFDHANLGGFDGSFTRANALDALRQSLRESAVLVLGEAALGVLITDIARRDL